MNFAGLIRLFLFPGLLFAVPAGWFFVWAEHKAVARMQRRIGPPLLQPFWDFVKLCGKRTPARHGLEGTLLRLYPAVSVIALIGALALLPVCQNPTSGFSGDFVLMVALLELPSICFILAGFTSGSIYGEIGAIREAILSVANNVVLLLGIVTIAVTAHSFHLTELAGPSLNPGHWIGVLAIFLTIPAKLRLNPFSTSAAEQEIYAGPLTEYAGAALGLWELAHALEWLTLTGLVSVLVLPPSLAWWIYAPAFFLCCLAQVLVFSVVAGATARLTLQRSINFYWRWAAVLAVLALGSAAAMRFHL
jgi:NADH-quinone oxidoreductase subunit H